MLLHSTSPKHQEDKPSDRGSRASPTGPNEPFIISSVCPLFCHTLLPNAPSDMQLEPHAGEALLYWGQYKPRFVSSRSFVSNILWFCHVPSGILSGLHVANQPSALVLSVSLCCFGISPTILCFTGLWQCVCCGVYLEQDLPITKADSQVSFSNAQFNSK